MKVQKVHNAVITVTWNEFNTMRKLMNMVANKQTVTLTQKEESTLKCLSSNMNKAN